LPGKKMREIISNTLRRLLLRKANDFVSTGLLWPCSARHRE
jgi:hypothetical protein